MTTWTDSARTTLEGHLTRMRKHLDSSGADPFEVTDDVRRHIDEEVAARKIGVVTTEDVESILRVIGLPESPHNGRATGTRIEADLCATPRGREKLLPGWEFASAPGRQASDRLG
jgi:hypothetical protein